eukprot:856447-Lingulodinium_polyedra.AAC.1
MQSAVLTPDVPLKSDSVAFCQATEAGARANCSCASGRPDAWFQPALALRACQSARRRPSIVHIWMPRGARRLAP